MTQDTINKISGVAQWAISRHDACGCEYDDQSYGVHLEEVVGVAVRYLKLIDEELHERVLSACWCHDLIEDCRVTYNDLVQVVDIPTADIVYAVTNELGKNRKERALKTYPKIAENDLAVFVKLCDRIANTRRSIGKRMFSAYDKEYATFRYALRTPGRFDAMWDELHRLMDEGRAALKERE